MKMELDKSKALLTGVCAGFARSADVDLMLTRVTMVLITLFFAPIAIPAYLLTAALLKPQSEQCSRGGDHLEAVYQLRDRARGLRPLRRRRTSPA